MSTQIARDPRPGGMPEFSANLRYQLTPLWRANIGYTFMLLTNVVRPGDQVDPQGHPHPPLPKPSNLKILPADISQKDLLGTMIGFSQGLGVPCMYCHAEKPGVDPEYDLDFASDAKPLKEKTRLMIRMTAEINGRFLSQLPEHRGSAVGCGTCHQGHAIPAVFVPRPPTAGVRQ